MTVFLICSCEEHHPGELPQVQRDLVDLAGRAGKSEVVPALPTPAAKPTPAEFFPKSR